MAHNDMRRGKYWYWLRS